MQVAFVHDHLTQEGGAERVLQAFQAIWPEAPTYTLVFDPERLGSLVAGHRIVPSFLQRFPGARRHPQWYLPLMPTATESYDLRPYDVVLSSCSALAKGVITRSNTVHLCYCHTPTRYLWSDTHQYVADLPYPRFMKWAIRRMLTRLRAWDQQAAQRVDRFIANSRNVSERIAKYYRRDSVVVYPPVDVARFTVTRPAGRFFLTGGRLVPYKRFDLVVQAFNRLGIPLQVFGEGPESPKLRALAKPNVRLLGKISPEALAECYARCRAFIQPQVEDFGITAVEAMAAGRPVIAYGAGGAMETVVPGLTGALFEEQTWESLADAVVRFQPEAYEPEKIRRSARQFSAATFSAKIRALVEGEWQQLQARRWPAHRVSDAIREHRAVFTQTPAPGRAEKKDQGDASRSPGSARVAALPIGSSEQAPHLRAVRSAVVVQRVQGPHQQGPDAKFDDRGGDGV